jgi:hypothetical protein
MPPISPSHPHHQLSNHIYHQTTRTKIHTIHSFILLILLLILNVDASYSSPSQPQLKIASLRPTNATVPVKGAAIFECRTTTSSSSFAQISWKKNGKRVSETNKKFKITQDVVSNDVVSSILRINDVNHALNITCVAESVRGGGERVEQTVHLATIGVGSERDRPNRPIPLIRITNPKSVEPDSLFRIECNVTSPGGLSDGGVHWYQANRPVDFDNSKYFTNVSRIDAGIFIIYMPF